MNSQTNVPAAARSPIHFRGLYKTDTSVRVQDPNSKLDIPWPLTVIRVKRTRVGVGSLT